MSIGRTGVAAVALAIAAVALVSSCATTSKDGEGSATHFECRASEDCLAHPGTVCQGGECVPAEGAGGSEGQSLNRLAYCSSVADCTAPLECYCGVCTKPCTATSDCAGFGGSPSCQRDVAVALCNASSVSNPDDYLACLVACTSDADCSSLGANGRCVHGNCYVTPAGSEPDAGLVWCVDRMANIGARLSTVGTPEERACTSDFDCVSAPAPSCFVGCGLPYVSRAAAAVIQAELPSIDAELCGAFDAAGCKIPTISCPAFGPARCVGGTCYDRFATIPDAGG